MAAATQTNLPLLEVARLGVRYAGTARPAVEDVSFILDYGTILGIVGESGAGKSTLGLALAGLLNEGRADLAGEVRLSGQGLLTLTEKELCAIRGRQIGMIFQDPAGALDPAMRVVDQVAETLRLHTGAGRREAQLRARQQLAAAGVSAEILAAAPYAHQLSGGLCQRVMIAAALAAQPSLLIADEPTSSLDVTLQAQILSLLRREQRHRGLAVIFISHDLALVSRLADRMLVMRQGRVVDAGKPAAILDGTGHSYTRELVSASSWKDVSEDNDAPA